MTCFQLHININECCLKHPHSIKNTTFQSHHTFSNLYKYVTMLSEAHLLNKIPTVHQIKGFKLIITLEYFDKSSLIK